MADRETRSVVLSVLIRHKEEKLDGDPSYVRYKGMA